MLDLLIGGSPCQGFSFAGKQLNFEDERSKLFFEYVKALKVLKPKYFILENVKMKKEYQDVISEHLGVEPIGIDSALVSAQRRKRLYWTNIPGVEQPKDKGILLKDIVLENDYIDGKYILSDDAVEYMLEKQQGHSKSRLEERLQYEEGKSYTLTSSMHKGVPHNSFYQKIEKYIVPFDKTLQILDNEVNRGKVGYFGKDGQGNRVYHIHGKSVTLCGEGGGRGAKTGLYLFGYVTSNGFEVDGYIRKLTPVECERLQTLPDNYTEGVSDTQRYKMLGNSFTVDVIAHILSYIPETHLSNVLSLFDGISCARVALDRVGKTYDRYFASEIDKYALKIANKNYSDSIQLGDVTKINWERFKEELDANQ